MVVQTDVGYFGGCKALKTHLKLQNCIVRLSQVSDDDPAFQINGGQQISVCLLAHECRCNLFFVVIDNLLLLPLFFIKVDLPEFNRLVG